MLNLVFRIASTLAKIFIYFACVAGLLLTIFVVLASVMRYVFGSPFGFTEELVGLLFLALVFLALPYAAVNDQHIRVTIVTDHLAPRFQRIFRWISYGLIILFCMIFFMLSWEFMAFSFEIGAKSDVARIVLFPWMALMPIGIALLGFIVFLKLVRSVLGFEDDTQPLRGFFG